MSKRVLLFTATWCGPCKLFKPEVQKVCMQEGVQLVEYDSDEHTDIFHQYRVKSVPALVVEKDGELIFHATRIVPRDEILDVLQE